MAQKKYIHTKTGKPYTLITDNFMFKENGEWRKGLILYHAEYENHDRQYFARTPEDFYQNFKEAEESNEKSVEMPKDLIPYNELYDNGVRVGDIIAQPWRHKEGIAWEFVLLRKNFPENYDASLCCYLPPSPQDKMYLTQIGFHWCGDVENLKFRKATEEERKMFIDACIRRLKVPIDKDGWGWQKEHYSQILGNMRREKLISNKEADKLNKELMDIHGVDLLKFYKETYGY